MYEAERRPNPGVGLFSPKISPKKSQKKYIKSLISIQLLPSGVSEFVHRKWLYVKLDSGILILVFEKKMECAVSFLFRQHDTELV